MRGLATLTRRLADRVCKGMSESDAECRVLRAIATMAESRTHATATTLAVIAVSSKCPRRTVQRAVDRLQTCAKLAVEPRPGGPSLYQVLALAGTKGAGSTTTSRGRANPRQPAPTRAPHDTLIPHKSLTRARVAGFAQTWNDHCDTLPRLRKTPEGAPAVRLILSALDSADNDLALLGRSIARAAADRHYRENRFGFETFCRHVDRWLDDRDSNATPVTPRQPQPRVVEASPLTLDDWRKDQREELISYARSVSLPKAQLDRMLAAIDQIGPEERLARERNGEVRHTEAGVTA